MVIAVLVRQYFLERGCVDLIGHRLAVDGILHRSILNHEDPVLFVVGIETARLFNHRLLDVVADTVWVEVVARHGVRFVVDKSVVVAVDGGVDTEREDVLMVGGKDAWMDDSAPWHLDALVDGRGAEYPRGANLVGDLPGLIEHESQDVFVVRDGDDGLEHQLPISDQGCSSGTLHNCQSNVEEREGCGKYVVDVLPANAGVLLVNAYDVLHRYSFTFAIRQDTADVVDGSEAVTSELEVVRHDTGTSIAKIEGGFLMEWRSRVRVRNVHVRER